ncbi:VENN motif pre-toxin domain-containing protein, partial [Pseudomonas orientalis]|uniref:VENN motif pre-toxin domain-containing protein n=1 Tax=Pseudomonas orientalis TaxID=76758 RepID=UPI0034D74B28
DYQRAAQAVTAALQGLAGGDIGSALAGASAPYLANLIKQSAQGNDTARIMAHVVLGAVVAQAQGNSAVAGAAGAGTGELIAAQLYPGIKTENLSEKQKQTVSALSTLASGLAGGLAGGDLSGALAGAKAGNNAVENNSVADIAIALTEGKTLEQKAEERINAENEHYKEQNCAGLSAEACSAQMYAERRESLAYTLAGGAVVIGTVAGGMLLGPALLNACGMNPVACTELTIAAAEVPFGAAMAGGGALGVGGFGSLGAKEVAATADAAAAARNVETEKATISKNTDATSTRPGSEAGTLAERNVLETSTKIINQAEPEVLAKVNSGRSPYSELNGAIGEARGWNQAIESGQTPISGPGKASLPGADYITYDPLSRSVIVWDAKYRAPGGSYPTSLPDSKLQAWQSEIINSVKNMPEGSAKAAAESALKAGRVEGRIFKWPQ